MTAQLRADPVDTTTVGWHNRVATSVGAAFDADLTAAPPPPHRADTVDAVDPAGWARRLLAGLTWGYGKGLPEDEWISIAAATTDRPVDREDISWVLAELGRYVVQDGEDGVAVYRAAHQSLADHLRAPYRATQDAPFDPQALPVTTALLNRYGGLLRAGRPVRAPGYLWRYSWRHTAAAGPTGLNLLRALTEQEPVLRRDVALAATQISSTLAYHGRHIQALPPAEEATRIYRDLTTRDPELLPDLAGAVTTLGARYSGVGRPHDALAATEEAVTLYRTLAVDNPAYQPDLAAALNNLGALYSDVGRPH